MAQTSCNGVSNILMWKTGNDSLGLTVGVRRWFYMFIKTGSTVRHKPVRSSHGSLCLCVFQMQSLQGGEDAMLRLDQLEALYYELQLQLYDIQAEVLRCEELLLTAQLQSLRRQMTGEDKKRQAFDYLKTA